jgi:hypothetical protein
MLVRTLAFAALIVAASSAEAADADGRAAPKGFGLATCEQFLEMARQPDNQNTVRAIAEWVNGYLTASNIYMEETYDIAPWQNPVYLLNVYARLCQQQPEQRFVAVVHFVNNALRETRLTKQQEMVTVEAGEQRMGIYKDILQNVQQSLIDKGYLKGTADGAFGPMTRTALEAYQTAQQLAVTGVPDSFTVERLLFAPPPEAEPAPQGN